MSRPLLVAMAQYAPLTGADPVADLHTQAVEILSATPDLNLIAFPEIHLFGSCDVADDANEWLRSAAEPLDGPRMRALSEAAADLGVWLIPGSVAELGADGRVYNTEVVFNATGDLVTSYRKVFPWRPYEAWSSGHEFVVFDMPGIGRGGLSICYDAWFPESTRSVAWMGAEFVVNVVKTIGSDRKQERILAQANAIANQVFMLSVNAAGPIGAGGSLAADPEGTVVAELPTAESGLLTVELDLDDVDRVREQGTEGLNRMWSQMAPNDPVIDLPIYAGRIDPNRWRPRGTNDH
jgi:predicted amidohydrolase